MELEIGKKYTAASWLTAHSSGEAETVLKKGEHVSVLAIKSFGKMEVAAIKTDRGISLCLAYSLKRCLIDSADSVA